MGELFHSPTSYNSMFCSISLNVVWVKGFFFMVPHEEYGTPRLIFMMKWLEHIIIHICSGIICYVMMMHIYMDAPMICIWVTWTLMISLAQHLVHLMLEELHPTLGWIDLWLENIFVSRHILCYIFMILSFMDVWVRLLWFISSLLLFCSLFGSDLSGDSSFTSWMKEYMAEYFDAYHILLKWHYRTMGSSPMWLEQIWLVTWSLYALGKWWSTYLEV